MDYQSLHNKTVADLRKLAKEMRVRIPAGTNKQVLIEMLLEAERVARPKAEPTKPAAEPAPEAPAEAPKPEAAQKPAEPAPKRRGRPPAAKKAQEPPRQPKKAAAPEPPAEKEPEPKEPVQKEPVPQETAKPAPAVEKKPEPPAAPAEKKPEARLPERRMLPRPQGSVRAVRPAGERQTAREAVAPKPAEPVENGSVRGRREGYYNAEYKTSNPAVPEMLNSGECAEGAGVLEIQQDGYGFLRAENCLPGPNDVYISIAQIRRFNLRMGDYVVGKTRPQREGDRYSAMLYITSVNGEPPEKTAGRRRFEDLVPIYPDERLRLEQPGAGHGDISLRLIDMLAPIGKGQRGMIVSQPKAGKTTLLKKVANAITAGYPEIKLIVMLIDERPEEVTDMKRSIDGEVIYSTFDEAPENHVRVSEMVLERAQRLVEMGQDVVVLMDSITRLARAYNLVITPTGRSLSGGLDPGALFKPKRFFGAARNIEGGGSLTVIATALVETGSRMDDIIFEEFKGTGNMELHLDRKLSDKRVFPAIDMVRSGTRREELLLSEAELDGELLVRRVLSGGKGQEMAEQIISLISKTTTNAEFFEKMKGWVAVFEKEGYTLGGKL